MVVLFEASRFSYCEALRAPDFRKFDSKTPPGFRIVGLSQASRHSYGWILRGPMVFVWMESFRPSSIRMVGLLEKPRFPPS